MKMRKQNEGITVNTINWLHSTTSILRERERKKERERERERETNPL